MKKRMAQQPDWDNKTGGGQTAFGELRSLIQKAGLKLGAPVTPAPQPLSPEPLVQQSLETDEEIFLQATADIRRLMWRHRSPETTPPGPWKFKDPDDEGRRLMEAAVHGDPELQAPDHPEYIEGWIGIAGRRFLPHLRNGLYSIQGQIDLHGLSQEEARQAVEDFIARSSRFRPCCVKIIHGRGINSPKDKAVLKECLQRWLSTRRMSRHVIAYASAPLNDGGVGAIYVLLKR